MLFDVGCIKDGYCSDMTRTFYFKTVSDEHRKVYETAKAANETAISKIHPGVEICNLDKAARDLITDAAGAQTLPTVWDTLSACPAMSLAMFLPQTPGRPSLA